jgi:fructokinase
MIRIGVDFGGTKIEAAALDAQGRFRARVRAPSPGDYRASLETVREMVAGAEREAGVRGASIGVGIPGSPSPATGLIRNANTTHLNGKPLQADLERILERPVRLANDANCFALSEATDGAGADGDVVFGVIVGTGCGAGVSVGGRGLAGRNGIAGEWGHTPLPWPQPDELPGPACYCGKTGCIETFLSGAGLARAYAALTQRTLAAHDIAAAATREADARATLATYQDRLARGLASVVNIVDPDVIVLGGGLSNIDAIYEGLLERIASYAFSDALATRVERARHGDSSGVRGAAWLWPADSSK